MCLVIWIPGSTFLLYFTSLGLLGKVLISWLWCDTLFLRIHHYKTALIKERKVYVIRSIME